MKVCLDMIKKTALKEALPLLCRLFFFASACGGRACAQAAAGSADFNGSPCRAFSAVRRIGRFRPRHCPHGACLPSAVSRQENSSVLSDWTAPRFFPAGGCFFIFFRQLIRSAGAERRGLRAPAVSLFLPGKKTQEKPFCGSFRPRIKKTEKKAVFFEKKASGV